LATLAVALTLSVAWIALVWDYVNRTPGWDALQSAPPVEFATFLASVAAPLAALWLVAAFMLTALALFQTQADVRTTQRQAVRTAQEIETLVRTSIEMQEQARRQSFLNGAELALKDLNSQAGMITSRLGVLNAEETEYLWALNAAGDPWAFCHALLERSELQNDFVDLVAHRVAGDEVASAALQRFLRRYERLLTLTKEYDADKLVREVLEDGPLDRLYTLFQQVSTHVQRLVAPTAPAPDPDDGRDHWDGQADPHDREPLNQGHQAHDFGRNEGTFPSPDQNRDQNRGRNRDRDRDTTVGREPPSNQGNGRPARRAGRTGARTKAPAPAPMLERALKVVIGQGSRVSRLFESAGLSRVTRHHD